MYMQGKLINDNLSLTLKCVRYVFAAEYLTYVASVGEQEDSIEMCYEDENIWLTQKNDGYILHFTGYTPENIEEPLMREIRYLDKLVDELAKGKAMEKILRKRR